MWTSRTVSGERRAETRRPTHVQTRLRASDARVGNSTEALIEDRGPRGVRLTSATPILPDTVVVLYPAGERCPLQARVVWTRRAGSGWRAGCRLIPSGLPARRGNASLVVEPDAQAVRFLVVAGLIGIVALFVYAILSFATLIGEAAAIGY